MGPSSRGNTDMVLTMALQKRICYFDNCIIAVQEQKTRNKQQTMIPTELLNE